MKLSDPLVSIKGVGDVQAKKFENLGVYEVADLINYYPRRYDDYSNVTLIKDLQPGPVSLKVKINNVKGRYGRNRGLHITEAIASDSTASVRVVWFNQSYRAKQIKSDKEYYLSGNYELKNNHFTITNPSTEVVSDLPVSTARILSIYPETKGLDSRHIRKAIIEVLPEINKLKESLPGFILKSQKLLSRSDALRALHMPMSSQELNEARRRLGFEEVFEFSLASLLNKQENEAEKTLKVKFNETLARKFRDNLPFKLTNSQRKAIWQVYLDMEKTVPMNRLIEGDVGSGKTVVAVMSSIMAMEEGRQVALMAPTELLARQHADTIFKLLQPLGLENKLTLLVGSLSQKEKKVAYKAISEGKASFIVGTHALIQEGLDMHDLALVIVDEQHRFGVKQRTSLLSKAGHMPHLLSLSATPIPRSLALTLYGELSITRLNEKPAGREAVATKIIYDSQKKDLYQHIDKEIEAGRQVFIVCPSITKSELNVKSVNEVYDDLKKSTFKHRKLGLLHGQLKSAEKQKVMEQFVRGEIDILVATTVIEVGVDIPNASIMLVMSPERFGLAQLHQLRGRIGRGEHRGHFYMLLDSSDAPLKRLRALERSSDGFDLAELDLELRGPGAIYGTYQHGALDLRIANLSDKQLIHSAVNSAQEFIDKREKLSDYALLHKKINKLRTVTNLN